MMLNQALEYCTAYLLLGGNLGNREANLKKAIELLNNKIGKVIAISSLYETAAWGKTDQPAFLNQAVALQTNLSALEVLNLALSIEQELGRVRKDKWGERLIDIDLILFGDQIINIPDKLQVPHPYMQNRKFVMEPLAEIAPEVLHPVLGQTILSICRNIDDPLEVKKL
ncbi:MULTISPECIES: 2-amino-4-hydroxy-6-hydroxymethyldihydropteridine diphosphokinase [unclassified Pedobacter]|uniref:2-amino-4-hydroxy-6- hydroxymethyldihydropteridine diphosphokinase n=1 Tax=unclassified Pedobacter TaxID=2628915 RepID=UPI0014219BA9|nr:MULTISPECIES: 2-amino-4-hydroxy-6-hydroxymethyldihydropteridine diphosphokinase [unclassified Pedobacter]NII81951.1 2-amino-4-hydroxy-6-hydroxymethyldihydropteridine diphosphokinase [Pedobacter sp. SG908]NMN35955.1 2-amino-4-hydroxy-6-hydroxymethyldihydropteridine diphosphokinase [Pedobacter sp. SG918]